MIGIDKQRPWKLSLFHIGPSHKVRVERYDGDVDFSVLKFLLVLTQLRQMFTAGQSTQMPMKHQQQPAAGVVFKTMRCAIDVRQREVRSRFVEKFGHMRQLQFSEILDG